MGTVRDVLRARTAYGRAVNGPVVAISRCRIAATLPAAYFLDLVPGLRGPTARMHRQAISVRHSVRNGVARHPAIPKPPLPHWN